MRSLNLFADLNDVMPQKCGRYFFEEHADAPIFTIDSTMRPAVGNGRRRELRFGSSSEKCTRAGDSCVQGFGTLSSRGLGPVRLGMSEVQVRAAFRSSLKVRDSGPGGCLSLTTSTGDVAFILQDDKLRLVEVLAPGITTRSGLAVGMQFEQVKKTLRTELEIGVNFHDDATVEAIVWEDDRRHGVLFEARDGRVTAIRAGDKALEWVEGCGV